MMPQYITIVDLKKVKNETTGIAIIAAIDFKKDL